MEFDQIFFRQLARNPASLDLTADRRPMLEERLQRMLDHYEIVQLLGEYSHACDRLDEAQMAAVYAPDSWDDHGNDKCSCAEFARRTAELHRTYSETMSHLLGQTLTTVE